MMGGAGIGGAGAGMGGASMGGVGRGVSLSSLSETSWKISPESKRKYNLMFNTNDKNRCGFVSADGAKRILTRSNLNQETLRKIW